MCYISILMIVRKRYYVNSFVSIALLKKLCDKTWNRFEGLGTSNAEYFGRKQYCPLYLCQLFLIFPILIVSSWKRSCWNCAISFQHNYVRFSFKCSNREQLLWIQMLCVYINKYLNTVNISYAELELVPENIFILGLSIVAKQKVLLFIV
jgi:hypothetical protein